MSHPHPLLVLGAGAGVVGGCDDPGAGPVWGFDGVGAGAVATPACTSISGTSCCIKSIFGKACHNFFKSQMLLGNKSLGNNSHFA